MPGALKSTNFTILHPHRPYKFLNNLSSSSSSATTTGTTVESTTIIRLKYSAGWWRRATSAHRKITSQIFGGPESYHLSSDYRNRELDSKLFCNSKTNIGAKMCATVNGKVENQSDVSPAQNQFKKPPPHPSKLLTLPTMLTIGRVAAVPLLVGSMYWIFVPRDILFFMGLFELFCVIWLNIYKKTMLV